MDGGREVVDEEMAHPVCLHGRFKTDGHPFAEVTWFDYESILIVENLKCFAVDLSVQAEEW